MTMNRTVLFSTLAAFGLAACNSPRIASKDYCDREQRRVTSAERYVRVLMALAKQEATLSRDWAFDGGIHFLNWRKEFLFNNPDMRGRDRDVAYEYIARYPECCRTFSPGYMDKNIIPDWDWNDRVSEAIKQNPHYWVIDVGVSRKIPASPPYSPRNWIRLGLSSCNEEVNKEGSSL